MFGQITSCPATVCGVASGLTIWKKFRDEGRDILFFVDNIYRYTLAGNRSVCATGPHALRFSWVITPTLAGRKWVTAGATPCLANRPPLIQVVRRRDDLTGPTPCHHLRHLDSTVVHQAIARCWVFTRRLTRFDPILAPQLDPLVWWAKNTGNVARARRTADLAALRKNCATSSRSWAWTSSGRR